MWAAGAVLALSLAVWFASLWGICWESGLGFTLGLRWGDVVLYDEPAPGTTPSLIVEGLRPTTSLGPDWPRIGVAGFELRHRWRPPAFIHGPQYWCIRAPLWIPALCATIVLAAAWRIGQRAHRSHDRGVHCLACGYDLTGIRGKCPECGREPERAQSAGE
jgi:hypothetical protein